MIELTQEERNTLELFKEGKCVISNDFYYGDGGRDEGKRLFKYRDNYYEFIYEHGGPSVEYVSDNSDSRYILGSLLTGYQSEILHPIDDYIVPGKISIIRENLKFFIVQGKFYLWYDNDCHDMENIEGILSEVMNLYHFGELGPPEIRDISEPELYQIQKIKDKKDDDDDYEEDLGVNDNLH